MTDAEVAGRAAEVVGGWLDARLAGGPRDWLASARGEIAGGVDDARFCALLSTASRHVRPRPLAPTAEERASAAAVLAGWEPERWSLLEAARVELVLARRDLADERAAGALEEAFRFADEGELRALYRSLAFLPDGVRFVWRAGEGCRSNMRSVFEATALDTPFPATHFDEATFNQAVIKCVFVEAPLWRLWGLDDRLNPDLARMALDLVEERRSAHRPVQRELWLCVGTHGGERGVAALELEMQSPDSAARRAAGFGLARAGEHERLRDHRKGESDPAVAASLQQALDGDTSQGAFRALEPGPA